MTTYRKTAKGSAEIETRAHRLLPRLRSALILVDGKRSDAELQTLIQSGETLALLLEQGFIEIAPEQQPLPRPRPAAPAPAAAAPQARDIAARGREAARLLTDLVGPMGEAIAIRLESVQTAAELRPLIELAQQVLANTRGRDKAAAFGARFSDL